MIKASRLLQLQPGIFTKISDLKQKVLAAGMDVIDLSIGSPDMPPPPHVKEALLAACADDRNYGYTLTDGILEFKKAVTDWYRQYYNVILDPHKEVLPLMGSQDGLAHIHWALLNPGDVVLVPDPGYPIYYAGVTLAGGEIYPVPLLEENDYLPDLKLIPESVLQKTKMMLLNYPSNPLAATADKEFLKEVVTFARNNNIIVCHDFAYSELSYDGFKNTSLMEIPGAKEVGVEFHSISKTFNMAGCRLGVIVGNPEVVEALRTVKSNIDYGVFRPVLLAAVAAFNGSQQCVKDNALAYQKRRDVLVDTLAAYDWNIPKPKASMFVWVKLPAKYSSSDEFATSLLENTGVAVVPGIAFGSCGEGYIRIGLLQNEDILAEAGRRMGSFISK